MHVLVTVRRHVLSLGWEESKKPDVVGKDKNSYTLLVGNNLPLSFKSDY